MGVNGSAHEGASFKPPGGIIYFLRRNFYPFFFPGGLYARAQLSFINHKLEVNGISKAHAANSRRK
jgi:hypothetical protein